MAEKFSVMDRTSANDLDSDSDRIEQNPAKRRKTSSTGSGYTSRIAPVLKGPMQTAPITPAKRESRNTSLQNFELLKVQSWLVKALKSLSIRSPTPIQEKCIPKILEGRDCIGSSRTGSGKTLAFAIPILQKWAEDPMGIYAVVLTPTRELALQIYEQFLAISSSQSLKAVLVIGGADMRLQALEISKRPHIIIATPGRLADHIRTSGEDTICGLRKVRTVVLDEADRLLSPGPGSMLPDVGECLNVFPLSTDRQTLLFTATMTPEVMTLKGMPRARGKAEVFICEVETQVLAIPSTLNQLYMQVPVTQRESFLHVLLQTPRNESRSIIIFCNRTSTAQLLHHMLQLLEHKVVSLHSKLAQKLRNQNLARFRASESRILVATDVAARGLDIPEVGLVINYDVPQDPDDYIHRVGRTARAGRKGEAITFVGQRDVKLIHAIEARVGREMAEYEEENVNVETRVIRDGLRIVNEKKREALLDIEENRDINGRRRRGMRKISGQ